MTQAQDSIRFTDGETYERYMGAWSKLAGAKFLDWLAPKADMRWLDVGCGNGVFTEMLVERCAPLSAVGIDPSEEQLAFARTRPASRLAEFRQADAMALPFSDDEFDAAVMALVLFFVPDPKKSVTEMARVVRPGGTVASYGWDLVGGGFPYAPLQSEMRAIGVVLLMPPSLDASSTATQRDLWTAAGLTDIETREITVDRTFADFDTYWSIVLGGPSLAPKLGKLPPDDLARLKDRMRTILPTDAAGRITCEARANAIRGRVTSPT
jgi:SAM-dependent methyltransferase